ncbi:hypothetical protein NDU88_005432 [Pleurodeles waltl]|uniref:Uncharacterized protein n=1 Tax=Pleurodeles waltl TaxID=8319 RepID=A0AAV7PFC7_PLEWA|nr:hypothetical protein NDU88_005432 [Pleurodeles waltl]
MCGGGVLCERNDERIAKQPERNNAREPKRLLWRLSVLRRYVVTNASPSNQSETTYEELSAYSDSTNTCTELNKHNASFVAKRRHAR